jgi:hypothetical protein
MRDGIDQVTPQPSHKGLLLAACRGWRGLIVELSASSMGPILPHTAKEHWA